MSRNFILWSYMKLRMKCTSTPMWFVYWWGSARAPRLSLHGTDIWGRDIPTSVSKLLTYIRLVALLDSARYSTLGWSTNCVLCFATPSDYIVFEVDTNDEISTEVKVNTTERLRHEYFTHGDPHWGRRSWCRFAEQNKS